MAKQIQIQDSEDPEDYLHESVGTIIEKDADSPTVYGKWMISETEQGEKYLETLIGPDVVKTYFTTGGKRKRKTSKSKSSKHKHKSSKRKHKSSKRKHKSSKRKTSKRKTRKH